MILDISIYTVLTILIILSISSLALTAYSAWSEWQWRRDNEPEPEPDHDFTIKMWIARDQNGDLYLYPVRPTHFIEGKWEFWDTQDWKDTFGVLKLDTQSFPGIKATDKRPTEVVVQIKINPPF